MTNDLNCTKHLPLVTYSIGGTDYLIRQHNSSLDHGTTLWDAGKVLALYMHSILKNKKKTIEYKVLELGAGCGLTGLVTASLGLPTILTDQQHIVGLIKSNIKTNANVIPKLEGDDVIDWLQPEVPIIDQPISNPMCIVDHLTWGDSNDMLRYEKISQHTPFTYILAADCIYDHQVLIKFMNTLNLIVNNSKTLTLVALEPRDPLVIDNFIELAKSFKFYVSKIPGNKLPSPYNTNDGPCDIYKVKRK